MTKTIRRIPRPTSLTSLLRLYNRTKDKDTYRRILNILITNMVNGTLYHTIKGELTTITLEDLSVALGLGPDKLLREIDKRYQGLLEDKDFLGYSRAVSLGIFNNGLKDRHKALSWASELQAVTRKRGYNAMLVKETNSAIQGAIQSNALLIKIVAMVQPKNGTTPTINIDNHNQIHTTENHTILTPDMAIKMISGSGQTGLNPANREALYLEEGIQDTPEVRATFQDVQAHVGPTIPDTSHEERRAQEYNVVPEER